MAPVGTNALPTAGREYGACIGTNVLLQQAENMAPIGTNALPTAGREYGPCIGTNLLSKAGTEYGSCRDERTFYSRQRIWCL